MARKFFILFLLLASPALLPAEASVYVVEPLLVTQPPAAGMSFYVYRPAGLPEGWFVTFDGYAVTRTSTGIWVYGTMNGSVPAQTNYTVGSANPALLPIVPYSVHNSGSAFVASAPETAQSGSIPFPEGPFVPSQTGIASPTYMPRWALDAAFKEVSLWNNLVDRMAMLETPRAPLAWKGDNPKVIFAWTGRRWFQMTALNPDRPENVKETLKYHLYSLTRLIHKSGVRWENSSTPMLISHAARWGYFWAGEVRIIED